MKRIIAFLVALGLLLCGCQANPSPVTDSQPSNAEGTNDIVLESPVSAADYYRYLNDVFLPEDQLASTDAITVTMQNYQFHYSWDVWKAGGTGLASVFIDDFDGDGTLEMLTVEVEDLSIMDTFLNRVCFDDGAPYNSEERCLRLFLRHYIYENDQIVEYGTGTMNVLPDDNWGKMVIGIEKIGDEFYLFSKMSSENMSTYGPTMYTACRIGGNSLSPSYTAPINFGRANQSNYLELMGLQNTLNTKELSLDDLVIPNYMSSVEKIRESLGNRLLCVVDVDYPDYGADEVVYQLTDYTRLRENLKENGENWEKIELPEGYVK